MQEGSDPLPAAVSREDHVGPQLIPSRDHEGIGQSKGTMSSPDLSRALSDLRAERLDADRERLDVGAH